MTIRSALFAVLGLTAFTPIQAQRSCCCGDLVVRIELDADSGRYTVQRTAGAPLDGHLRSHVHDGRDENDVAPAMAGDTVPELLVLKERVGCGFVDTVAWKVTEVRTGCTMQLTFLRPVADDLDLEMSTVRFTPGRFVLQAYNVRRRTMEPYMDLGPFRVER